MPDPKDRPPIPSPQDNSSGALVNNTLGDFAIEGWRSNGTQPFGNSLTPSMEAAARELLPFTTIAGDLIGAILNSPSGNPTRTDAHQESLTTNEDDFQGEHFIQQVQGQYLRTTSAEAAEARSIGMPAHEYKEYVPSLEITGDQSSARLTVGQINSRESVSQSEPDNIPIGESRIVADEDLAPFPTLYIGENTQTSLASTQASDSSLASSTESTGQPDLSKPLVNQNYFDSQSDTLACQETSAQTSLPKAQGDDVLDTPVSSDDLSSRTIALTESYNSSPSDALAYQQSVAETSLPRAQVNVTAASPTFADTSNTRLASRTDSYVPNRSSPSDALAYQQSVAETSLPRAQVNVTAASPTLADTSNTTLTSRADSYSSKSVSAEVANSSNNTGNANILADNPSGKNTSASASQDNSGVNRQTVASNNPDSNATIGEKDVAKTQTTPQNVASTNDLTRSSIAPARAGSENLMMDAIPNARLAGIPNKALAGD